MAGRKRNLSATFEDDGYEYVDKKILIRRITTKAGIRYQVDLGKSSGKYVRKSFETRAAARREAKERIISLERSGLNASLLTEPQKKDAAKALAILKEFNSSLEAAATYYAKNHQVTTHETLTANLIERYIEEKKDKLDRGIIRLRTYRSVVSRMRPLNDAVGDRHIDSLTHDDIMSMLAPYADQNRENYRLAARSFFGWAKDLELMTVKNPVDNKSKIEHESDPIEFYDPMDVRAVMANVVELHSEMVAFFALAFFAGIRSAELLRLDWRDIRLNGTNPTATIKGSIAKKKYLRRIKLEPNCVNWLATVKDRAGPIAPFSESSLDRWRKDIFKTAEVEHIDNGARHSYASYHLQSRNRLGELLQNMGHKNSATLLNHYAGITDKETADEYFEIRPNGKLISFKQGVA